MFPEGALRRPGPTEITVRPLKGPRPRPGSSGGAASGIAPGSPSFSLYSNGNRQLLYSSPDSIYPVPVAGINVVWHECEYYSGQCFGDHADFTASDGSFTAPCPGNANIYYVEGTYQVNNGIVSLSNNVVGSFTEDGWSCLEDNGPSFVNGQIMQLYDNFRRAVSQSRALFSPYLRGNIVIYTMTGGISHYDPWNDAIYMAIGGSNAAVYHEYGLFGAAHEYGHAIHNATMGGIHSYGSCSNHDLAVPANVGCAFAEGFADYHAVLTVGSSLPYYGYGTVNNTWLTSVNNTYGTGHALATEGPFAAYLLDLPVQQGESWDLGFPVSYVASLIANCRVKGQNNLWFNVDGSDYFLNCSEQVWGSPWFNAPRSWPYNSTALQTNTANPFGWSQSAVINTQNHDIPTP